MTKINFFASLLLFLSCMTSVGANDDLIGMCNDCHGSNGVSTEPDIPTIASFSDIAMTDMLIAYIDETRPAMSGKYRHGDTSRPETDMITVAKQLTEEQIEFISRYYAEQKFVPAKQSFDSALVSQGKKIHEMQCAKCHDEGGSVPDDDTGLLAGQWTPYLAQSFKDYRAGKRETDGSMLKAINELSESQIKALLSYYASHQ